jgi:hypothetical protein
VEVYMTARMIVTGLAALFLSSIPLPYSTDKTSATPAPIRQPQSAHPSKTLRIFIEEDFSTAQRLKRELASWSGKIGVPIVFVEKDVEPHDLLILLASDSGSGSGSCSGTCSGSECSSSASCTATVTLHFVSAVVLTPDGKLQFTETGVGSAKTTAITPLARKLAKRFSVLPDTKATPSK